MAPAGSGHRSHRISLRRNRDRSPAKCIRAATTELGLVAAYDAEPTEAALLAETPERASEMGDFHLSDEAGPSMRAYHG